MSIKQPVILDFKWNRHPACWGIKQAGCLFHKVAGYSVHIHKEQGFNNPVEIHSIIPLGLGHGEPCPYGILNPEFVGAWPCRAPNPTRRF